MNRIRRKSEFTKTKNVFRRIFVTYTNFFTTNKKVIFMQTIQKQFKLHSEYAPTGDQPQAIKELVEGFKKGNQFQTLLGVTGSGKTFTMANV